jgi:hypothetical protein
MFIRMKIYEYDPPGHREVHNTYVKVENEPDLSDEEIIIRFMDSVNYAGYGSRFIKFPANSDDSNSFFDTVKWAKFVYNIERNVIIPKI